MRVHFVKPDHSISGIISEKVTAICGRVLERAHFECYKEAFNEWGKDVRCSYCDKKINS